MKKGKIISPFQGRQGQDLYETSAVLYYFLQVVMWFYIAGAIAYLVLIANVNIRHTYQVPPSLPGTLVSDRYGTFTWIFLMLSVIGNLFIAVLVPMLVLWRKDRGCTILWMVFLVIFTLLSVFTVVVLGGLWGSCNAQNQNGNICNDLEYCCAVEIYSNPANGCSNTGPCMLPNQPSSISQLRSNVDFRWLFAVSIVFMLFDITFFILLTILWFGGSDAIIKFPRMGDVVGQSKKFEPVESKMVYTQKIPTFSPPSGGSEATSVRARIVQTQPQENNNNNVEGKKVQELPTGITHTTELSGVEERKPHANAGKPGVVIDFSNNNKKAK